MIEGMSSSKILSKVEEQIAQQIELGASLLYTRGEARILSCRATWDAVRKAEQDWSMT